ncbi:enoyl-CoA hydratase/isomerase family protein [Saccharopolyspora mangrovi]|uniref:Enoyl-CoA hydratase-related protein n=1 Tax=Saccharopolyspora mangrovi TaxID=3082379 RepID=A0ABU6AJ89_9PSEU|nr:enoyl-CoA hydratase-related protein [Saccharopolyspora sp. S2-29]MEB3371632.1 enoyl-CoA hydratase-related protein [Saccharopolyspora sp. S2-29]
MSTVDSGTVVVDRRGPVLTLTLNRPERKNAIDGPTWGCLFDELRAAELDEGVRAVVLTGAGGDFCAGADLSAGRDGHPLPRMHRINDVALALHELSKPVIAKVRGVAVGAGWNLALGCDLVVSSPDARFSQIFAKRGLSLDFGGSWLLPRVVGLQQAKRLALLGEIIGAEEARELGLVTWVKDDGELDGVVDDLADRLAAGASVAISQSKAMLNAAGQQTFREALEGEARAQSINFATADAPAAFRAFKSKTEPEFTGEWLID